MILPLVWLDLKRLTEQPVPAAARRVRTSAVLRASRRRGAWPGRGSCGDDHGGPENA